MANKIHSGEEAIAFDCFQLFPARKLLLEAGKPVRLGSRAFDILIALASNAGAVVSKDDLIARVWPGLFVEEGNLRVHVAALRRSLGDGQGQRRFIVTTSGRGYSFIAPVSRLRVPDKVAQFDEQEAQADNLPIPLTKIVGRDDVIELLALQLPQHRFITIVGPGGIGKTTVAMAVGRALRQLYRDGVRLIDLAPITDPALVPSALAAILGVPVSSDKPIPNLITVLRDRQMLLVFDNCEHLIDAAASLAEQISKGTEAVHILATSREALRGEGELVRRLPPLETPSKSKLTVADVMTFSAVQLFVDRASATFDNFRLTEADAVVVADICRRLDGIALAIELAAARVDTFGVKGVASRLDDRFRLLNRGRRTALPHHQTLSAMFDWSYEFLGKPTQVVFQRLSIFAGIFTLESANAIAQGGPIAASDVADQVANLVSTSLLSTVITGDVVSYRLLDSTRAYARAKLNESAELGQIACQHAKYFCHMFERATAESTIWPTSKWLDAYSHYLDDVRAALDWTFSAHGDITLGIAITLAAVPLWTHLSLNEECRTRAETALLHLDSAPNHNDDRVMQLSAALGNALTYTKGTGPDAIKAWTRTLAIAEAINNSDYQLRALRGLFTNAYSAGDLGAAKPFAEKFSRLVDTLGLTDELVLSDRMMGMTFYYTGELKAAHFHTARALAGIKKSASGSEVLRFQFDQRVVTSVSLVNMLWLLGLPDQAEQMVEETMEHANSVDHSLSITYALAYAACPIALQNGDLERAENYLALLFEQALLDPTGQWELLGRCWKGVLHNRKGGWTAAMQLLAAGLEEIPEGSFRLYHSRFLAELALAMGRSGMLTEALGAIDKAIEICDRQNERWFFAEVLRIKGELVLLEGGPKATTAAEKQFERALDLARQQEALALELRSATSLARLRRGSNRVTEARDGLAGVYSRFTEGFNTFDLKEARSILRVLSN